MLKAKENNLTFGSRKGILTSTELDIEALSHLFRKNWNQPQYVDKSSELFEESLEIASKLEMRPLMEHVLSQRDILKA